MADADKTENFVSKATIYQSGSGQPFAPGTPVTLPRDHAEDLRKAGLEHKAEEPKQHRRQQNKPAGETGDQQQAPQS